MKIIGLYCLLFVFSSVVFADSPLKIISLQHRFPQDILPAVQSLVGENGSASAMQNNLLIRTTPERMLQIEELIVRLDTEQKNLRITISHEGVSRQQDERVGVSGSGNIGEVDAGLPSLRSRELGLDIKQQKSDIRRQGNEFVTVLDGERAYIRVGQSVPFTRQWYAYAQRYPSIQHSITNISVYQDITTGFAVRPRIIGTQVEVEIVPRISSMNASGYIDFEELSTTVRLKLGQWLDLGGIMQTRDDVSRTILSHSSSIQTQDNRLMIKVE